MRFAKAALLLLAGACTASARLGDEPSTAAPIVLQDENAQSDDSEHGLQDPYQHKQSHENGAHVGPRYIEFPNDAETESVDGFRPAYVRKGYFRERAEYERALEGAETRAIAEAKRKVAEKQICRLCTSTLSMGRVLVDEERDVEGAETLVNVTATTCPLLTARFSEYLPELDCDRLVSRVRHFYSPKFEGRVPLQGGERGRVVNYALVHLLHDCGTYLGIDFCPSSSVEGDSRWKHWAAYIATDPYQRAVSKAEREIKAKLALLDAEREGATDETPRDGVTPQMHPVGPQAPEGAHAPTPVLVRREQAGALAEALQAATGAPAPHVAEPDVVAEAEAEAEAEALSADVESAESLESVPEPFVMPRRAARKAVSQDTMQPEGVNEAPVAEAEAEAEAEAPVAEAEAPVAEVEADAEVEAEAEAEATEGSAAEGTASADEEKPMYEEVSAEEIEKEEEAKAAEAKKAEPKQASVKQAEPKQAEPKQAEPKQAEPKAAAAETETKPVAEPDVAEASAATGPAPTVDSIEAELNDIAGTGAAKPAAAELEEEEPEEKVMSATGSAASAATAAAEEAEAEQAAEVAEADAAAEEAEAEAEEAEAAAEAASQQAASGAAEAEEEEELEAAARQLEEQEEAEAAEEEALEEELQEEESATGGASSDGVAFLETNAFGEGSMDL